MAESNSWPFGSICIQSRGDFPGHITFHKTKSVVGTRTPSCDLDWNLPAWVPTQTTTKLAGVLGFEPRLTESKSIVLTSYTIPLKLGAWCRDRTYCARGGWFTVSCHTIMTYHAYNHIKTYSIFSISDKKDFRTVSAAPNKILRLCRYPTRQICFNMVSRRRIELLLVGWKPTVLTGKLTGYNYI
jgi:hypothetical protein